MSVNLTEENERLRKELEELHRNVTDMLNRISDPILCKCGTVMYFLKHKNGKRAPYTSSALNHFIDCPLRDQFRKEKK